MTQYFDTAELAIEAAENNAKNSLNYFDFDGQNCDFMNENANCAGWDGLDSRCDCGNRRVYWETEKNSNGKYYAYASAY